MTISTDSSRNDFLGNGVAVAYPFTFTAFASTDVTVYLDRVLQVSGYTIAGTFPGTGTVTFTAAPAANVAVAIVRATPHTQGTHIVANDPFPASVVETALDRATVLTQQVKELATRAWRFAVGSAFASVGYIVDEPKAGAYARVKSDCSGIEFVSLTSTGTYADPVTSQGDLVQGGNTGVAERLGVGSCTNVLGVVAGKAAWRTATQARGDLSLQPDACGAYASAATLPVTCDTYQFVSGSTGVTALAAQPPGTEITLVFAGSPTLTNARTNGLILHGCGNYTAVGCDTLRLMSEGGGVWRETARSTRPAAPPLNLRIIRNVATPTTKLDVTADRLIVGGIEVPGFAGTIDATATGANGLDTGALGASTLYYVWAIYNASLHTAAGLLSTSETAPTTPGSFTRKQLLGAVRTGAGSTFLDSVQRDDEVAYTVPIASTIAGTAGPAVATTFSGANIIPATTVKAARLLVQCGTNQAVYLHWTNFNPGAVGNAPVVVGDPSAAGTTTYGNALVPCHCGTKTTLVWGATNTNNASIWWTGFTMQWGA